MSPAFNMLKMFLLRQIFSQFYQVNSDHDIARITEMGFRAEEASAALKSSNGNVQQAIESLLSNRRGPAGRGGPSRQYSNESRDSDRGMGRGRRERREEDEGRIVG